MNVMFTKKLMYVVFFKGNSYILVRFNFDFYSCITIMLFENLYIDMNYDWYTRKALGQELNPPKDLRVMER